MASPPPNPKEGEEGGSEFKEEPSGERPTAPQKTFIAPPASQLPTKLQYVTLGASGPSGIKQLFRTVKVARRIPTLPRRPREGEGSAPGPSLPEARESRGRKDHAKRHVCSTCDKRFSSPGKLSQHVLSHTGELPFSCDLCDKRFNSKFKLVRHNLIHSEARAFACNVCGKTFNRKDHLTNHVRVHNPVKKLYTCERPDCRKSYTSLLSFRKHAALHSAEEGNLQCKICDMNFTTRQDIIYHLKVHTGSRTVKNDSDKKFTCNYCDRKFFTAKDVRRHLVVHTGRRDFLCPHCPQKFGRKDHLVRHVKNAHPEESWKSAAVGTSSEPPPEASAFEETYTEYPIEGTEFSMWKPPSPKESTSESGQPTRVPSTDIIVEIPPDLDIKVEPIDIKLEESLEIKLEQPGSPGCTLLPVEYPMMFMVAPPYAQPPTDLPFLSTQELPDPMEAHLLHSENVESLLMDPGEGPSGLSSQMLGLLEDSEPTFTGEEGRVQQRLPAFTQAFQTAQSPKPPPPPPPPH
ncbi:zinc finger protein PLAGL1 [Spodoptera frugiperda]|uniref:Zinc finger protein PLAGL1 n=1 Tax=Spodoptera frugiperda TaxID=7108 RepID=A0A9R0DG02_SPOFR|nr:zinc finger protein PLAGL1 [Spodoptera frugiperda]